MLEGANVVVTGASSGIGAATAEHLAAQGAKVALLARRKDRLTELAGRINGAHPGAGHVHEVDVADAPAVEAAFDDIARTLGGVDVLINCAGTGSWGPAVDADLADWRRMVDVNVMGVLVATHAALPHLVRATEGRRQVADIVTISSIAGRKVPSANGNVYAATKHAVGAFSEALRQELAARHVRVGLVEPGIVTTEMTTGGAKNAPDARSPAGFGFLDPADVADAIAYMIGRPRHVAINEILLRPTEQVI